MFFPERRKKTEKAVNALNEFLDHIIYERKNPPPYANESERLRDLLVMNIKLLVIPLL